LGRGLKIVHTMLCMCMKIYVYVYYMCKWNGVCICSFLYIYDNNILLLSNHGHPLSLWKHNSKRSTQEERKSDHHFCCWFHKNQFISI